MTHDPQAARAARIIQNRLADARRISTNSRDPSTRTGCILTGPDDEIVASGYNRLPPGTDYDAGMTRDQRLALTVHAEINALICCSRAPRAAFVWPWPPCQPCTAALLLAGVRLIVAPAPTPEQAARWADSWSAAKAIAAAADCRWLEVGEAACPA